MADPLRNPRAGDVRDSVEEEEAALKAVRFANVHVRDFLGGGRSGWTYRVDVYRGTPGQFLRTAVMRVARPLPDGMVFGGDGDGDGGGHGDGGTGEADGDWLDARYSALYHREREVLGGIQGRHRSVVRSFVTWDAADLPTLFGEASTFCRGLGVVWGAYSSSCCCWVGGWRGWVDGWRGWGPWWMAWSVRRWA